MAKDLEEEILRQAMKSPGDLERVIAEQKLSEEEEQELRGFYRLKCILQELDP